MRKFVKMRSVKRALFAMMLVLPRSASAQEPPPACGADPMASYGHFGPSIESVTGPAAVIVDAFVESTFPEAAVAGSRRSLSNRTGTEADVLFRVLQVLKGPSNLSQVVISFGRDEIFEPRHCGEQMISSQRYILFLEEETADRLSVLPARGVVRYRPVRGKYGMFGIVDGAWRLYGPGNELGERIERMTLDEVVAATRSGILPTLRDVPTRTVVEGTGPAPRVSLSLKKASGLIEVPASAAGKGAMKFRLPEGQNQVQFAAPLPPGYTLKSVNSGGTDLFREPLTVTASTAEIVFTLAIAPNALRRLGGQVMGLDGFLAGVTPALRANAPEVTLSGARLASDLRAPLRADGSFDFGAVPQGSYRVRFRMGSLEGPEVPVSVSDSDNAGLQVPAPANSSGSRGNGATPGLVVSGRVVIEGEPNAPVPFYSVVIGHLTRGRVTGTTTGVISTETFRTTLMEVMGPEYVVSVTSPGYAVTSITMGAKNLVGEPLRLQDAPFGEIVIRLRRPPPATSPLP